MANDSSGKTLTLKKKAGTRPDDESSARKRSGARARNVARLSLERDKQAVTEPPTREHARRNAPVPSDHTVTDRGQRPARNRAAEPMQTRGIDDDGHLAIHQRRQPRRPNPAHSQIFPVFAPCPQGLEEALCAELQALGYDDAQPGRAGCRFHTDWTGILKANLYSRLATRILVQVAHAPVHHEDDILELAAHTPWERWFGPEQTLRVDTSAVRSPMQSLQYCNLRAKDGICDRLRDREGARPDIDTVRPDARVHLFLDETSATLYLDTSGESLFKRGWRLDKGEAPLRENLAAGLLALSGWDPSQALLDPFCGSGTLLIEGAWIALGVPPGIWRPFSFERLRNHDARVWKAIKEEARSRIAPRIETPLVGTDIDPRAIEAAYNNLERAWLTPDTIRFEVADARQVMPPAESGWLVTNPPYGERLAGDDTALWAGWASHLKQNYADWHVNIITSDLDLPTKMRLKPKRRFPVFNGGLECRLFSFDMVRASYRS
jgi:putative N6-adenine-specific DNA methylase